MNAEMERTVIGAWLYGEHLEDIYRFSKSDFPIYSKVFAAIKARVKKDGVDFDIAENLLAISRESEVKLEELTQLRVDYVDLAHHHYQQSAEAILEHSLKLYISNVAEDTPLEEVQKRINSFVDGWKSNLPAPERDWLMDLLEDLDDRASRPLINTGIPRLDQLMCGLRRKELTTIGARPSVGKSAFTLQVALNVVKQGYKVLYFPLEMSTLQTAERILVGELTHPIPNERLKKGELYREEWDEINVAMDRINKLVKSMNFLIFEGVNNIHTIEKLVKEHEPFLVVIDQLEQLTSRMRFKDKRERFSYMTNSLKRLTMVENVAVMLAAQLNRTAQKSEPTMAELKESGSIEEDSDNVILLHRLKPEDMENPEEWSNALRPIEIKLEKNRSGETGSTMTQYNATKFKFYEYIDAERWE